MFKGFTGDSRRITGIDDPRFSESMPRAINDIGAQVNDLAHHVAENMGSPFVDDTHNRLFWCEITYKYKDDTDGYTFRLLAFSSSGKFSYQETNDHQYRRLFDIQGDKGLLKGQRVLAMRTDDGTGKSRYYIIPAIPHAVFPVHVTQVYGSNGTATTACTWAYDVYTIDDAYKLGTIMSPLWGRAGYCKKIAATLGDGYYTAAGTFVLQKVNEEPDAGAC